MQATPFDALILKFWPASLTELGRHSLQFVLTCRALFLRMQECSDDFFTTTDAKVKLGGGSRAMTEEDLITGSDNVIGMRLAYFQFLEQINIFGRITKKENGSIPPTYNRIYFFRNKMIEHVDEYMKYMAESPHQAAIGTRGKVMIPFHFGTKWVPAQALEDLAKLKAEFKKIGIDLPENSGSLHDSAYSDTMYSCLERIHPDLQRNAIPESLLEALFRYSFPSPIWDVEAYSENLVLFIEGLPIQN